MERAIDIANYICKEYRKISGEAIDEMKLHKLLYFSQRENIAITGTPLFDEIFEGWRFGPVCVSVRKHFYEGEMTCRNYENLSEFSEYIVKNIVIQYGEMASWKLSRISHKETSWINSRKGLAAYENGDNPLKLEDIISDAEKVRPYDPIWDMYIDEFENYEESK